MTPSPPSPFSPGRNSATYGPAFQRPRIPAVSLGSARDIGEQTGVARFVFSDVPRGNSAGKPDDVEMQRAIVGIALDLLEEARFPRTTIQTPFRWDDDTWRASYMRVDDSTRDALQRAGEERRDRQTRRRREGRVRVD